MLQSLGFRDSLIFLHDALKEYMQQLIPSEQLFLSKQLQRIKTASELIVKHSNKRQSIAEILDRIQTLLAKDEGFLFPIEVCEHCFLMEVVPSGTKGIFEVAIINTGEGCVFSRARRRKLCEIVFEGVTKEQLSRKFFEGFLTPGFAFEIEEFNKHIHNQLFDARARNRFEGDIYYSPQKGDNCAFACLLVYVKKVLGLERYLDFKNFIYHKMIGKWEEWKKDPDMRKVLQIYLGVHDDDELNRRLDSIFNIIQSSHRRRVEKSKDLTFRKIQKLANDPPEECVGVNDQRLYFSTLTSLFLRYPAHIIPI